MRIVRFLISAVASIWASIILVTSGVFLWQAVAHPARAADDLWLFLGILVVSGGMLFGLRCCFVRGRAMEETLLAGILAATTAVLYFLASRIFSETIPFEPGAALIGGLLALQGGIVLIRRWLRGPGL